MTSRTDASAPCERLPWDSEFFGLSIGKVNGDTLDEEQAAKVDQWAHREKITCLYFLARSDCPRSIQTAERSGFDLADIRTTFDRAHLDSLGGKPPTPSQISIRPAQPDDLSALQAIARTAHNDTRFFSDPHFPRAKAEALYTTWIELECQGRAQQVFVAASSSNQAKGYISCHSNSISGAGQIGLIGVSSEFRGQGLGQALVLTSLHWFAGQQASQVTVVTQGRNLAAQRLYQRSGFLIRDLQLWYHKWYLT
jgi:dTDP-4-amino-4,6-dideoxy-D-galactose acyltransferase